MNSEDATPASQVDAIVNCEHDQRFRDVFGLPAECKGCLACMVEHQEKEIVRLSEHIDAGSEAVRRLSLTNNAMSAILPAIALLSGGDC